MYTTVYTVCIYATSQRGCEEGELSGDLDYTIQRLVRGLASGRKAARHGFFVTLIEVHVYSGNILLQCLYVLPVWSSNR